MLIFSSLSVAEEVDTVKVLKDNLGTMIKFVSDTKIQFCPSQKCEIYKISKKSEEFPKYVFLNLFHSHEYINIEEYLKNETVFKNNTKRHEAIVRNKLEKYCNEDNKTPECILSEMQKALNITECWANYDEGNYCEVCNGNTTCRKLNTI